VGSLRLSGVMNEKKAKEFEARMIALQARHKQEAEAMRRRHKMDLERLERQYLGSPGDKAASNRKLN
jgi:hypothetical protein